MRVQTILVVTSLISATSAAFLACGSTTQSSADAGHSSSSSSRNGSSSRSGSSSSSATPSGPTDADVSACTSSASAACALLAKCNPNTLSEDYGDAGACAARELISCETALITPNNGATVSHTTMCATAEGTESCADYLNLNVPAACNQVVGQGATGSTCSHPGQCTSGFCAIAPASSCGTCQPLPTVGASCAELTTCGQGLDCYKNTCVRSTTTVGGTCSSTQPCGAGLGCVTPSGASSGTCQTTGSTVGAACDPSSETAAACDEQLGLTCVTKAAASNAKTCQPIVYVAAGSPCGTILGVKNLCTNGTCDPVGDGGYTCVARAADKAACNTVAGPSCQPPARCIGTALDGGTSGTCQLPVTSCP